MAKKKEDKKTVTRRLNIPVTLNNRIKAETAVRNAALAVDGNKTNSELVMLNLIELGLIASERKK